MAGSFCPVADGVAFVPRFPFVDGETYALCVDGVVAATLLRPVVAGTPSTEVVAIHPSGDEVPLNLLRIYVHFSAPMSEGFAASSVRMLAAKTGEELAGTFLRMEPELWDREHRRLTVFLDPARIKRGLVPHLESGYPLAEGAEVDFAVGDSFRDAAGLPLISGAMHRYRVGGAVRARINTDEWSVAAPRAGTCDPLSITFDRPLDHGLLQRCLSVEDSSGKKVGGRAGIEKCERRWMFAPAKPWDAQTLRVVVDTALEDVAGNALTHVFDRDLTNPTHDPIDAQTVAIDFTCAK